jgi:hypothetical protein
MERSHSEQNRMEFGKPPEELLTAREVAKRLKVSVGWVSAHASGKYKPVLPSLKLGGALRFKAGDIDAFLERCRRAIERGFPLQ